MAHRNDVTQGAFRVKLTPVAPQVYANVEDGRISEVLRSNEPCVENCTLLRQYAKEYNLG